MKKFNIVINSLLALGLCATMFSCAPATEKYLNKYEKFVSSVSEKSETMTEEDWTEAQKEYDEYMSEYENKYMDEFSTEENQRFGQLQAKYTKVAMQNALDDLDKSLKQGAEVMEGYLDEMME